MRQGRVQRNQRLLKPPRSGEGVYLCGGQGAFYVEYARSHPLQRLHVRAAAQGPTDVVAEGANVDALPTGDPQNVHIAAFMA